MPLETVDKIWMDGELVDWDQANIHILTHAPLRLRCVRGHPPETSQGPGVFRLTDHMVRLRDSAQIFMIDVPTPWSSWSRPPGKR